MSVDLTSRCTLGGQKVRIMIAQGHPLGMTVCGAGSGCRWTPFFLVKSFVTLIVVIDPVSSVPLFLAMTDRYEPRQRHRAAWQAVLVAALIIAVFALFGQQILLYLGIRLPSLEAAGGSCGRRARCPSGSGSRSGWPACSSCCG
jgi:hypothetical protein